MFKERLIKFHYKRTLKAYNKLIVSDFGESAKFNTNNIDKSKFEEQLYNNICEKYKKILNNKEDFEKK
ncbi:hypothetical protein [Clostridium sp. YIM B02506]|uniref:hypothetical protein n=1 Tax=Clostridium sp. YIM B02506 TaxID=2910680 RepID=UPI001EED0797|nr:hypothetical protein [Clostridium sp. YIM B02506]